MTSNVRYCAEPSGGACNQQSMFIKGRVHLFCVRGLCSAKNPVFHFSGTTGCVLNHLQRHLLSSEMSICCTIAPKYAEIAWNNTWLSVLCSYFNQSRSSEWIVGRLPAGRFFAHVTYSLRAVISEIWLNSSRVQTFVFHVLSFLYFFWYGMLCLSVMPYYEMPL